MSVSESSSSAENSKSTLYEANKIEEEDSSLVPMDLQNQNECSKDKEIDNNTSIVENNAVNNETMNSINKDSQSYDKIEKTDTSDFTEDPQVIEGAFAVTSNVTMQKELKHFYDSIEKKPESEKPKLSLAGNSSLNVMKSAETGVQKFLKLMTVLNTNPLKCKKWLDNQDRLRAKLGKNYKEPVIYSTVKMISMGQTESTDVDKTTPKVTNALQLLNVLYLNPDKCNKWLDKQLELQKIEGDSYEEPPILQTVKLIALHHSKTESSSQQRDTSQKNIKETSDENKPKTQTENTVNTAPTSIKKLEKFNNDIHGEFTSKSFLTREHYSHILGLSNLKSNPIFCDSIYEYLGHNKYYLVLFKPNCKDVKTTFDIEFKKSKIYRSQYKLPIYSKKGAKIFQSPQSIASTYKLFVQIPLKNFVKNKMIIEYDRNTSSISLLRNAALDYAAVELNNIIGTNEEFTASPLKDNILAGNSLYSAPVKYPEIKMQPVSAKATKDAPSVKTPAIQSIDSKVTKATGQNAKSKKKATPSQYAWLSSDLKNKVKSGKILAAVSAKTDMIPPTSQIPANSGKTIQVLSNRQIVPPTMNPTATSSAKPTVAPPSPVKPLVSAGDIPSVNPIASSVQSTVPPTPVNPYVAAGVIPPINSTTGPSVRPTAPQVLYLSGSKRPHNPTGTSSAPMRQYTPVPVPPPVRHITGWPASMVKDYNSGISTTSTTTSSQSRVTTESANNSSGGNTIQVLNNRQPPLPKNNNVKPAPKVTPVHVEWPPPAKPYPEAVQFPIKVTDYQQLSPYPQQDQGQAKISAFERLGPPIEAKKPKLTINITSNSNTKTTRKVVEEHVPVYLRNDIMTSKDIIVKECLNVWPWAKPVKMLKEYSYDSVDALMDEADMMPHYSSKSAWIKVEATGYPSHFKKEDVLDCLINFVGVHREFVPCFIEFKQDKCTFLVNRSEQALVYLHHNRLIVRQDNVEIKLSVSLTNLTLDNLKFYRGAIMKSKLHHCYDSELNSLDLSAFQLKPDTSHFMYMPLNFVANHTFVMNIVKAVLPWKNITMLDLSENRLTTISSLNLWDFFPSLRILNLSKNLLPTVSTLVGFKGVPMYSLSLEGNPLCMNFIQKEHYVQVVRLIFPTLLVLDGVKIDKPEIKKNFSVSHDGVKIADAFLEVFFTLMDSQDRYLMETMYTEKSVFSITCNPDMRKMMGYKNLREFYMWCRQLTDCLNKNDNLEGTLVGGKKISRYFTKLPATLHDPYSFTVDVFYHTDDTTVMKVTGLFKIPSENLIQDEPVTEFSRTFVLKTEDGVEYKILNDMMYISNATPERVNKSFSVVSVNKNLPTIDASSLRFDTPPDDILKEKLTDILSELTGLKYSSATRCLETVDWNLKKALEYFVRLEKVDSTGTLDLI